MGKTINDFEEKLKNLQEEFVAFKNARRKVPEIGGTVDIAGMEWIILDKTDDGYLAITKGFENLSKNFDSDSNNWKSSDLRNYLNTKFLEKIEEDIGVGILPKFERDLTSLDGQTEYGTCMDKISLLTVDEYRKYRKYLPNTNEWWWLCTPWSTPCNGYEKTVTVVSPSGIFFNSRFGCGDGVRPFCIFPSSIFESEEE